MLEYANASFWLADASDRGPPVDGVYASTANEGLSHHNKYAEEWAEVNADAIREAGREGDAFVIVNSAFGSSVKHAGCTSLDDRVANFNGDGDGTLRSILNAIVNGGVSGLTNGHCAVSFAPLPRAAVLGRGLDSKSREMICRWMEMTAFTAIFRTHDGDGGASNGAPSAYGDDVVVRHLVRWSNVYVALSDYRMSLINEASFKGYPVVRHPVMHFPADERFNGRWTSKGKRGKMKKIMVCQRSCWVI